MGGCSYTQGQWGVNPTQLTLLVFVSDIHIKIIKMLDTLTGEDNMYSAEDTLSSFPHGIHLGLEIS